MLSKSQSGIARPLARGFTLIEVMIVVAILAVLAGVAGPQMADAIAAQRVRAAAESLHMAILKTRSEAIKRNAAVTLRPATGGWAKGWSIVDPEGGAALQVEELKGNTTITTTVTEVIYATSGRVSSGAGSFVVASSSSNRVRCVLVEASGRASTKDASSC
jgi:type IV fimbrial biogenesis protein FimT